MPDFSSDSPFMLIWTNPRKAMQKILATNPNYLTIPFAFATSLDRILFKASQESLGVKYQYTTILGASILLAIVYAFIWLYFFGWILQLTGQIFGGSAPLSHVRAALAWSGAPELISLCVWFALLLFSPEYAFVRMDNSVALLFLYLIMLIPSVWSLILAIVNLQEVQHFSLGKAIGNWIVFFGAFLVLQEIGFKCWSYFLTFI